MQSSITAMTGRKRWQRHYKDSFNFELDASNNDSITLFNAEDENKSIYVDFLWRKNW